MRPDGEMKTRPSLRFVLDQDTGSAIKGSARVDIFMGTGPTAQKKANAVFSSGDLYYLLLK
jgi:membrane-bound lytic murein transglycosylase A